MIDHYYILFRQKNQGVQTEKLSSAGLPEFYEYWEIAGEEKALRKVISSYSQAQKKSPCSQYAQ